MNRPRHAISGDANTPESTPKEPQAEAPPRGIKGARAAERHGLPDPSPEWIAQARAVAAQRREEWCAEKSRRWHASRSSWRPAKRDRPRCGALTRKGAPCVAPAVWLAGEAAPRNGRCRMHGGLSTGPRTAEGRRRCSDAARRAARARHNAKGEAST